MRIKNPFTGRGKIVVGGIAAAAVVAGVGTGTAVAGKQITSFQIKNGTIQTQDLTKNNFARFTATENVITGTTAPNPTLNNAPLNAIPSGSQPVALAQINLQPGTYHITGVAQFFHVNAANTSDQDFGQVTVSGLTGGLTKFYSPQIPSAPANGAQAAFEGTVVVTTANTPVVVYGTISGTNAGQAGAEISATQTKYVKLFHNGS